MSDSTTETEKKKPGRQKGTPKTGGRQKGTPNKITNRLNILNGFDEVGLNVLAEWVYLYRQLDDTEKLKQLWRLFGYIYPRIEVSDSLPKEPTPLKQSDLDKVRKLRDL